MRLIHSKEKEDTINHFDYYTSNCLYAVIFPVKNECDKFWVRSIKIFLSPDQHSDWIKFQMPFGSVLHILGTLKSFAKFTGKTT